MKTIRDRRDGQAAVEGLFALPIMLFLFLVGFQFFCITWDAQYVVVKSRYEILAAARHGACFSTDGPEISQFDYNVTKDVKNDPNEILRPSVAYTVSNTAYLSCE